MKTTQTWKIGDCLQLLPEIPDKSVDMILTDLPYGTSGNKWDNIISISDLFFQYKRIIKDEGAIVLTAAQPFTSKLIIENLDIYKYCWVWDKISPSGGFLNAKHRPLPTHEDIIVFSKGGCTTGSKIQMNYFPVRTPRRDKPPPRKLNDSSKYQKDPKMKHLYNKTESNYREYGDKYPKSVLPLARINGIVTSVHPTQKPIALFEYLIKTYTNEGDTVHDSCLGSGTTLEACANLNRNCIGFELLPDWEEHYRKRLKLDNTKLDAWTT